MNSKFQIKNPVAKILILTIFSAIVITNFNCSSNNASDTSKKEVSEEAHEHHEDSDDPMKDKGIGPVSSVTTGAVDNAMADKGKEIFAGKCTACHNTPDIDSKKIGPSLKGVSKRRTPEWVMNQILNPDEMSQKDPISKQLLGTYVAQMSNQNLTQDEARTVLEYFRNNDSK